MPNETNFAYRQVINYKANFNRAQSTLTLTLVGEPMSQDSINLLKSRMASYGLDDTKLLIK